MHAALCWMLASLHVAAQPDASPSAPSHCKNWCTTQMPLAAGNKGRTTGTVSPPQDRGRCTTAPTDASGVQVARSELEQASWFHVDRWPGDKDSRWVLPMVIHTCSIHNGLQESCGSPNMFSGCGAGQSLAAGTLRPVDVHKRGGGAGMQP